MNPSAGMATPRRYAVSLPRASRPTALAGLGLVAVLTLGACSASGASGASSGAALGSSSGVAAGSA
ncbi:MAG: hypothetical protein M3171_14640, partial [Actinomycetota bacterium]|nr:hypothetical protein [Actinomycetota bacterium]